MKKFFTAILFLVTICFYSCDLDPQGNENSNSTKLGDCTIKEIDGCEYLEYTRGIVESRVYSLTHKGNCKYCLARNNK